MSMTHNSGDQNWLFTIKFSTDTNITWKESEIFSNRNLTWGIVRFILLKIYSIINADYLAENN